MVQTAIRLRSLFVMIGMLTIVWVGFLPWIYSAVFAPGEIAGAKSVWRYSAQPGPTLIYGSIATLRSTWFFKKRPLQASSLVQWNYNQ